jgi:predicted small secreted protein
MTWKNKIFIIGAIAGVAAGLLAAYIVIQRAERENVVPTVTAGDGVKIGLGVLGVLRLVADVADRE